MKHLPRFRRRLFRNAVSVDDVVKMVNRAFEVGYHAGSTGKYRKPAKKRLFSDLADDLRKGRGL